MTAEQLRHGRRSAGLNQQEAARKLGVSQPYLSQLERGRRAIPAGLARRAASGFRLSPAALPIEQNPRKLRPLDPDVLERHLVALGYPGFPRRSKAAPKINPAEAVLRALASPDLDVRLVEALPWVLVTYWDLDWQWLIANCKLRNLQNRLGYLVHLTQDVAKRKFVEQPCHEALSRALAQLEQCRLAAEDTLCSDSMPEAGKRWVRVHRPRVAKRWNLLTDLTADQLTHAA